MRVCVAVPLVYGVIVLSIIYLKFLLLYSLLNKCEIKSIVFKNVV